MIQAIEVEQYFFADEVPTRDVINGHHINMYLKHSFIEDCKDCSHECRCGREHREVCEAEGG